MVLVHLLPLMSRTATAALKRWWGPIGGPMFLFSLLKPFILGKPLHVVEWPEMSKVHSVNLRFQTPHALRSTIAKAVGLEAEEQVLHVARHVGPNFTEAILLSSHVGKISENGWLIWSRKEPIPSCGVPLTKVTANRPSVESALDVFAVLEERRMLSRDETDRLVDCVLEGDEALLSLARAFKSKPELLERHMRRRYLTAKSRTKTPNAPLTPEKQKQLELVFGLQDIGDFAHVAKTPSTATNRVEGGEQTPQAPRAQAAFLFTPSLVGRFYQGGFRKLSR